MPICLIEWLSFSGLKPERTKGGRLETQGYAEDKRMAKTIPVRKQPINALALALVTVLALLVAPVCAPLCAARSCSSHTSQGSCHDMASAGAAAIERFVAAGKTCPSVNFFAVLVKTDQQSALSQVRRNSSAPVLPNAFPAPLLEMLSTSPRRSTLRRVPLELGDSLLLTTILRI